MAASNTSSAETETEPRKCLLSRSSGSALGETERGAEGDPQGLPAVSKRVQVATRTGEGCPSHQSRDKAINNNKKYIGASNIFSLLKKKEGKKKRSHREEGHTQPFHARPADK